MAATLIAVILSMVMAATAAGFKAKVPPVTAADAVAIRTLARPQWTTHVVTPRERLTQIAVRYGVRLDQVLEWNEWSKPPRKLRTGQRIKVKSRLRPPPRRKTTWVVKEGDTWRKIMRRYRVEYRDLRAYNWRVDRLEPGTVLTVWYDPAFPRTVNLAPGPPVPENFPVAKGGRSIGYPDRGRLEQAAQLPESDLYSRRHPSSSWGSSYTIEHLMEGMALFRRRSGFAGDVTVMAISRRSGRRFPPHSSHQSGRDVDIRLPLLPLVPDTALPNPDEIDWAAAWELIEALVVTEAVEAIYLDVELQRRLFQAALWEGMEPEQLEGMIQWPSKSGHEGAVVRHQAGHENHMHVRFRCASSETRCRSR